MGSLTIEQLKARFPRMSASCLRANTALVAKAGDQPFPPINPIDGIASAAAKRLRQSRKPLENELEKRWRAELEQRHPGVAFHPQGKRYRLANGSAYTPDITAIIAGQETAWECKGPKVFRGGFENLKMAAALWPEVKWILVWEEVPVSGPWHEQEILP